jgi:hypothetical protein
MSIELGREIDSIGSRHAGNGSSGGSRRSQHQEKLKALIAALKSGNLPDARACYQDAGGFQSGARRQLFPAGRSCTRQRQSLRCTESD